MKKLVVTALMFCNGLLFSLPLGNPSEASLFTQGIFFSYSLCDPCCDCCCWFDDWSLRLGYYGDFVFNRNLKIHDGGVELGTVIDRTKIVTNAAYLVLNLGEMVDIFATVGESRLEIETNQVSWLQAGNADSILSTETKFSWSAGGRATLLSCGGFSIGIEGQYFQTSPDITKFLSFDGGRNVHFNDNNNSTYKEWQGGVGISYSVSTVCPNLNFVPYAGVKWSWAQYRTKQFTFLAEEINDDPFTIYNLKANKLWGYAVGTSFIVCDRVGVTVEGRWGDENAFYVNGQFRF